MDAPRRKWSFEEEEEALNDGVIKYGKGKWSAILKDPTFGPILQLRSSRALKEKWRNGLGSRYKYDASISDIEAELQKAAVAAAQAVAQAEASIVEAAQAEREAEQAETDAVAAQLFAEAVLSAYHSLHQNNSDEQ